MNRRLLIALPLVAILAAPSALGQSNMMYEVELKSLAQEIIQDISQAGVSRAEIKVTSQASNGELNRLFVEEATDQFIMAGRRRGITILQKGTWNTQDQQMKDYADGRYRPDTIPRRGQTLAAGASIDISIQVVQNDQYRVAARVSDIQSGQAITRGARIIMPPQALREHREYFLCPYDPRCK